MAKRLAVIAGDAIHDIIVYPGTTPNDIRNDLSLPQSYWVSTRDGQPFGDNESVFALVKDGDKIYASPEASVAILTKRNTGGENGSCDSPTLGSRLSSSVR